MECYVGGYLLRKCLKNHPCQICQAYCTAETAIDATKFIRHFKSILTNKKYPLIQSVFLVGNNEIYRETVKPFDKLLMSHNEFPQYLSDMENNFIKNIKCWNLKNWENVSTEI